MPKTLLVMSLVVLLSPGEAVAGPPVGASGKMVFDEVGAGLDRYRNEKDPEKRLWRLEKLAKAIRESRLPTEEKGRLLLGLVETGMTWDQVQTALPFRPPFHPQTIDYSSDGRQKTCYWTHYGVEISIDVFTGKVVSKKAIKEK